MTTLVVLLWLVFLADALCRVEHDDWVVRPDHRRPLMRGGDFRLTALGEVSLMPLVPGQRFFVTSRPRSVSRERLTGFDASLTPLRWASGALGSLLLVVLPALALRSAFRPWVWPYCGAVGLLLVICLIEYHRLRRRFEIESAPRSWTLLLSPISLVHAPHIVTRHALDGLHPVELATHLLVGDALVASLRQLWWDLPDARDAIADVIGRRDLTTSWEALPTPDHEMVRSFCPRCRTQFVEGPTCCPDCTGVELERFDSR